MKSTVLPEFLSPFRDFAASWFGFPPTCENNVFHHILSLPPFCCSPSLTPKFPLVQGFHWLLRLSPETSSPLTSGLVYLVLRISNICDLVILHPGLLKTVLIHNLSKTKVQRTFMLQFTKSFSIRSDLQLHCHEKALEEETDLWNQYSCFSHLWQSSLYHHKTKQNNNNKSI